MSLPSTPDTTITRVPSLSQTSAAALLLCARLRQVGATVTSVQFDTNRLAEKIQSLWRSLDLLCQRFNSEDSVHTRDALEIVDAIVTDTQVLLSIIETLAPVKTSNNLTYRLLVWRRMKTLSNKVGVDTILRRLDFLHCTTELMTTTAMIGEKIRWSRAFGRGHANDNVLFQTIRLDDRPAKYLLAERVIAVAKVYTYGDDLITAKLPSFLTIIHADVGLVEEDISEKQYGDDSVRIWWQSLRKEWTTT